MEEVAAEKVLENIVEIKLGVTDGDLSPTKRKKQLVLREALVEWDKEQKLLEGKVERREKRKDQLTNEVYQLVGLYSVFVGVVFTAVLQSNRVECQHLWSPIALCSVAYFVILFVTFEKFEEIKLHTRFIGKDEEARKRHYRNTRKLISEGPSAFDFHKHIDESESKSVQKRSKFKFVVIGILTLFTLVLLASIVHVLCINETKCRCSN